MNGLFRLVLIGALVLVVSGFAAAAEVTDVGQAGTQGTKGIAGDPGTPGIAGGGASTANATASTPDPSNQTSAQGSIGGGGGNGGNAVDGPDADLLAIGGAGGNGGAGGDAESLSVSAGSASDVAAIASAVGGLGGSGGRGGSAAGGGLAGLAGLGGSGGDAQATANVTNSGIGEAQASATATAGEGAVGLGPFAVMAGNGGDARAVGVGTGNSNVAVGVVAFGGAGGKFGSSPGNGGNASSTASGSSAGIGSNLSVSSRAVGGDGSVSLSPAAVGVGGNAISAAEGIAIGNSVVSVESTANGGGGPCIFLSLDCSGGSAESTAYGRNFGDQQVDITAIATAGNSGPAVASARGEGRGVVWAHGYAATSEAEPAAVSSAEATTWLDDSRFTIARGFATSDGSGSLTGAHTLSGGGVDYIAYDPTAAMLLALPSDDFVADVFSGGEARMRVAEDFAVGGSSKVLGHVLLSTAVQSPPGHPASSTATAEFVLDVTQLESSQRLLVGLLEPGVVAGEFDSLHLQVNVGGGLPEVDQTFSELSAALDFFTGNVIDLGELSLLTLQSGALNVTFRLDLAGGNQMVNRFAAELIFGNSTIGSGIVPVPPAAVLFLSACGLLGWTRRRHIVPSSLGKNVAKS